MRVRIELVHEYSYEVEGLHPVPRDERLELQTSVVVDTDLKVQEVMDAMHAMVDRFDRASA